MDLGVVVVVVVVAGGVYLGCSALGFAIDKHWFPNPVGSEFPFHVTSTDANKNLSLTSFRSYLEEHSGVNAFFCFCSSCFFCLGMCLGALAS